MEVIVLLALHATHKARVGEDLVSFVRLLAYLGKGIEHEAGYNVEEQDAHLLARRACVRRDGRGLI